MRYLAISFLRVLVMRACILLVGGALLTTALATGAERNANALEVVAPSRAVVQALPTPQLAGQGQMRFLGFRIYDARLWVGPGFEGQAFTSSPLVLELVYHRAFSGADIAERSIQEIERQRSLDPDLKQRWTEQLTNWLPDVVADDRLSGWYVPGEGMQLWRGDQALGKLDDPELAALFVGIWLSPQTSEPDLRRALLSGLK